MVKRGIGDSLCKVLNRFFFMIHLCRSLVMVSALKIHGSTHFYTEFGDLEGLWRVVKCYEMVHNISAQEQRHSSDLEYMQGKMRGRACKTHVGVLVTANTKVTPMSNIVTMYVQWFDIRIVWMSESRQKTNVITDLLASRFIVICCWIADETSTLYSWHQFLSAFTS